MKFYLKILFPLIAIVGAISCVEDRSEDAVTPSDSVEAVAGEVRLVLSEQGSRAALAADGVNHLWQVGDRFTLIARNADGSDAFKPCNFTYWVSTTTAGRSFFRGIPNQTMADGNYTYYAVYPHTASVSGNTISYTLPAVQDGKYGSCDFMVAKSTAANSAAASGNALKTCDNSYETPEPLNDVGITFSHKLHALRITIPEGRNLMNVPIKKVYINMSSNVAMVGDITVDMSTMALTYTNTANAVAVEFPTAKNVGDEFWVMTLPMNVGNARVDLRFEDEQGNISSPISTTAFAACEAGHITPMTVTVPQSAGKMTYFDFTVDHTKLGEPVTHLHITPPSGCYYVHGIGSVTPDANGKFSFGVFPDQLPSFKGYSTSAIKYESAHAIVPEKVSRTFSSSATQGNHVAHAVATPYLFEEDFSTIKDYSRDDKTGAQGTTVTAYDLSAATYGLSSGWSGARTGGGAGASIRVGSRVDRVWGYTHTYGRLDSPKLSNLKNGASVKVQVSFNYSGGRDGDSGYSPRAVCGYTQIDGLIKGKTGSFSSDEDAWENIEVSSYIPSISTDGSYTSVTQSTSYEINNCQNTYRLSWMIRGTGEGGFISNGNQWMFIDNIKVSIVQ
ncbi:MAG: fimbrillin family protein [Alistipes sp.]|nr:fimbrillin family protein [Alistipes sp.]